MLMRKRRFECLKCLVALRDKLLYLGMIAQMLELPHVLILIALKLGHSNYLMCKGNLKRS